jgi:hypothetical protein
MDVIDGGCLMIQVVGLFTCGALAVIAAFHVVWAITPWPLATREDLARDVVGRPGGDLPAIFPTLSFLVAGMLGAAAYLVVVQSGALSSGLPDRLVELGTWGVAVVLLGRGVLGMIQSGAGFGDAPASYRRLDLRFYSPLCLTLGGLAAMVAIR